MRGDRCGVTLCAQSSKSQHQRRQGPHVLGQAFDDLQFSSIVPAHPQFAVEDARIDWTDPAVGIDRQVRACTPHPGAWSTFAGERIKIGPVRHVDGTGREPLEPGVLEVTKNAVLVGTATTPVQLGEVKAFGKRQMPAADWARGDRLESGARLDSDD